VAAASVPATGGAAVPGQRAHSTGLVRPPIAPAIPVFRPPAPASPAPSRTTGEAYGTPRRSAAEGTYGRPVAEQTGRRRADETAVDIGYTGRRSKPDHAAEESQYADWTDAEPGWSDGESGAGWHDGGSGAGWNDGHRAAGPSDGESDARWHDGEPDAAWHGGERGVRWNDGERDVRWNDGERDVRSNGGERDARWHDGERDGAWHDGERDGAWHDGERGVRWHDGESDAGWRDGGPGAGWAGAEAEPGYPGWAEADERYGTEWRGRERTGGW